jgi:hypothetical protein
MALLAAHNVTHVAYILILYSVAFLLYLFVNILLSLYATHAWPDDDTNGVAAAKYGPSSSQPDIRGPSRHLSVVPESSRVNGGMGWHSRKPSSISHMQPYRDANDSASRIPNGAPRLPRHRPTDSQQVRDAEEFELEGLMSEDDGDDSPVGAKRQGKKVVEDVNV